MSYRTKNNTIIFLKKISLFIIPPLQPFHLGVPGVFTLLVEDLLEEPKKLIHNLMAKTVHSIDVHDLPDKLPEIIPALLGHIYLNSNLGQEV